MASSAFTLLCVAMSSACLLDDKRVGGDALEPAPTACDRYCDRMAACFDEDERLCLQSCPDAATDTACRDAQLSVVECLEPLSCDQTSEPSQVCDDALSSRDEQCSA